MSNLHFPGLHPEAARWLAREKKVVGVGIDTPSLDAGISSEFGSHRALMGAGIWGLENLANLHLLPPKGRDATLAGFLLCQIRKKMAIF